MSLVYRLTEVAGGAPVTDVVVSHERPMHLVVVSQDLARFQHVHPAPTGRPGEYAVDVAFPVPGTYTLYAEFTRANGQDLVQRDTLAVGGGGAPDPAPLVEDRAPKTVDGVRVALTRADGARAGQAAALTFRLEDAATGEPLRDLQPYLGAPAHAVIVGEGTQPFAHTHGEPVAPAGAPAPGGAHSGQGGETAHGAAPAAGYGPELAVRHSFPAPGLYKVWGQLQTHDGRVITADFVVRAR